MHATQKPRTEFRITAACTVTDPVDRQLRLAQVYGLIMDFGRRRRVAAEAESDALIQPTDREEDGTQDEACKLSREKQCALLSLPVGAEAGKTYFGFIGLWVTLTTPN
jgi:hypothetical protein